MQFDGPANLELKANGIQYESRLAAKMLFAYGATEPLPTLETWLSRVEGTLCLDKRLRRHSVYCMSFPFRGTVSCVSILRMIFDGGIEICLQGLVFSKFMSLNSM